MQLGSQSIIYSLRTGSSHTHPCELYYLVSISRIQNLVILVAAVSSRAESMEVSLATASAVANTISAVFALGRLFGLPLSDAEIADGHDAAILAACAHIDTLFLAAE